MNFLQMLATLGELAAARPQVGIGSYPSVVDGKFKNQIVVRGRDPQSVAAGVEAVEALLVELRAARDA